MFIACFRIIYKMPRAKSLTEFEKALIIELSSLGLSCLAVAKTVRRSRTIVHNFLQPSDNYGKKVLEEDLKHYDPEGREEFCNLH